MYEINVKAEIRKMQTASLIQIRLLQLSLPARRFSALDCGK